MGASLTYLRKPQTKPHIEHVDIPGRAKVATGSIQGWRRSMEDAHMAVYDKDNDVLILGVFDGHGGKGVAQYVGNRMPSLLVSLASYKARDFGLALHEAFMAIDTEMAEEQHVRDRIQQLDFGKSPAEEEDPDASKLRVDLANLLTIFAEADSDGPMRIKASAKNLKKIIETSLAKNENPLPKIFEGPAVAKLRPTESLTEYELEISDVFEALIGRDGDPAQQGCTATAAIVDFARQEIICANAGDSRTVLGRDGSPALLSVDHKPSDPAEKLRVIAAGGRVIGRADAARVEGDLNLSRALGDFRYKQNSKLPAELQMISARPDIRRRRICSKDKFLVLGCDGIWEKLPTDKAIAFIDERIKDGDGDVENNLDQTIRDTLTAAMCKNLDLDSDECDFTGCDNMTLMIVRFSDNFRSQLSANVDESLTASIPTTYGSMTATSKKRKLLLKQANRVPKKQRTSDTSSSSESPSGQ
jgi:protein phosphatase 1G